MASYLAVKNYNAELLYILFLNQCGSFSKVQKSLVDLEKLASGGHGEHMFVPITVGKEHQTKVLTYIPMCVPIDLCHHLSLFNLFL